FRAVREDLSRAISHGRRAEGDRTAARGSRPEAFGSIESDVAPRYRGAPDPSGRPHQDEAVEESRHRLPREHLSDAPWREDRDAHSRSLAGHAGDRIAGLRALSEGPLRSVPGQA